MHEMDEKWIARAQTGDPEAFTQIVEFYQRPVFNLCYRMLGDPAEAEDAAQETFIRVYQNIRRYDDKRSFTTWLLSIAANYCIDQIRKQRMSLISIDETSFPELSADIPGPEAAMSRSEEQAQVRALLSSLHPVDRAAIIMYYWHDLSYEEISEALKLTGSAVKSRLHRARREMAQNWSSQNQQVKPRERSPHGEHSPAF